jgi:2-haloacid dehalogenase
MKTSTAAVAGGVRQRLRRMSPIACFGAVMVLLAVQASWPVGHAAEAAPQRKFTAIAFDFFVLFDPDSVIAEVDRIFPGKGRELTTLWRTRQFEYTWLRSITGQYANFSRVTDDALAYAAHTLGLEMNEEQQQRLGDAYLHLTPWPDTARSLRRLRASGLRVITIANFTPMMLRANTERHGLTSLFDGLVSTDANRSYKPEARAYRLGVDFLHAGKANVVFAAFGGWDAAGAKTFGYPTVWVNRFGLPVEELGVRPDQTVSDLDGLLSFVATGARLADGAAAERTGRSGQ